MRYPGYRMMQHVICSHICGTFAKMSPDGKVPEPYDPKTVTQYFLHLQSTSVSNETRQDFVSGKISVLMLSWPLMLRLMVTDPWEYYRILRFMKPWRRHIDYLG